MAVHPQRKNCCAILTVLTVTLVLALGLGLGLGLRHKHESSETAAQSTPANQSQTLPFLKSQTQSNLVLNNAIQGQAPQTRIYNFTVEVVNGAPDGVNRTMLVVNGTSPLVIAIQLITIWTPKQGMYPGPTIEANQGDRLIVNVQNNLPNATSIHWHGLFQNGTNFYDGTSGITQCGIPPGQSLTYNFTFGQFYGTTWYHAHSTQYTDGITGALIVHPTDPPPASLPQWDEELVVQMSDWYHDLSPILLAQYLSPEGIAGTQGNEPVPDAGTLNGLGQFPAAGTGGSYFNFTIQRGKTYRLRLINTGSFASIRFSVDNHPLTLIEADGTYLEPTPVAGAVIAVAQRYSVLLHANATASPNATYWMRATVQSDMFTYEVPNQITDIRGIISYNDAPSPTGLPGDPSSPDPGPGVPNVPDVDGTTSLNPLIPDPAPEAAKSYKFSVSFQFATEATFLGFMNTTSWAPLVNTTTLLETAKNPKTYTPEGSDIAPSDQFIIAEDDIVALDIIVDNLDDGDHPFHLHGHRPWIVGHGDGRYIGQSLNTTNPLRRDTVLIPAYSFMVLRLVTDNPGLWAFHCHIAWHMAAGLLMQISSLPSKSALLDIPQDIISQCSAQN